MAETDPHEQSITDNGHIILKCLKCRMALTDIWLTKPALPLKSKIKAKCCYCDGESSTADVEGGMCLGATDDSDIVDVKYDGEYESETIISQNVLVITSKGK